MNYELLEKIKQEALENKVPIIQDDSLQEVFKILKENSVKNILEIGTAIGYSAICFSEGINGTVDTIEKNEERANIAISNINKMGLNEKINVMTGDAVEILKTLDKKYDFIFIDAAKSKYPIFLEEALRLSKKGSIIVADNILYQGKVFSDYNKHKQRTAVNALRRYIKETLENEKLKSEILEVGDGLLLSVVL